MEEQQNQDAAAKQTLLSWTAPLRPYKKRSKNIMRFYIALCLLLSLVIIFFGDRILLIPLWAVLFLFYVLTVTPPPEVENKVTVFGIEAAGVSVRWESLTAFFFTKRFGYEVLTVLGQSPYYFRLYMVLPSKEEKKKLTELLSEKLQFMDKPDQTVVDKMIDWFSYLIPDDEEKEEKKTVMTEASTASTSANQTPSV